MSRRITVTEYVNYMCDDTSCEGHTSITPLSSPSEDMIERAAKRIHAWTNGSKLPWVSDTDQQAYRDAAEAALLAALWGGEDA